MNDTDDTEITELTSLDVQKLSGVEGPANSTPFLLLKSIDLSRPPVTSNANPLPTKEKIKVKTAKKLLKAQKRETQVRKATADAVKAHATERVLRQKALERAVKSSPNNPSFAYLLSRELLKAGREDDLRAARGLPPLDQASAIREASTTGVAYATGTPLNPAGPHNPRAALRSVADDTYTPESLPAGSTELSSLRVNHQADTEIRDLEKQLQKSKSAQEREILGFRLTRARLVQGHRAGVI